MILTSLYGQPLVPVERLASAVRRGEVRYALAGSTCTRVSKNRLTGCSPQARWACQNYADKVLLELFTAIIHLH